MLAVDVLDVGAKVGRRHELIDRRMDEHAGSVDPGFVGEDIQADARLSWLHRDAAHKLEMAREGTKLLVLEMWDLDAEKVTKLHEHLVHRGVARPLSDAVDARGEHFRSRPQGHHGVPGAKTEVVVKVDDQRRLR